MGKLAIMVSSVTNALRGQKLLASHGIKAEIKRSIGKGDKKGCGYSLAVDGDMAGAAMELLAKNGIKVLGQKEGSVVL